MGLAPRSVSLECLQQSDGGATRRLIGFEDGDCCQDGDEPMFVVGADSYGREITEHSNVVQVEDAPAPAKFLSLEDGSALQS